MNNKSYSRSKGGIARRDALTPEQRKTIAQRAALARWDKPVESEKPQEKNKLFFDNDGELIQFRFDSSDQSIWASLSTIAELFEKDTTNISKHIKNIYKDQELEESSTTAKFAVVQKEGGRDVIRENIVHYNLDVILSVGYRANSKKAVQFRKWANQVLRTFIEQGYVINEKALRESPEKLNRLAAQIRALRSEEKHIYAKVRECFKISASDYDPNSKIVRSFYALLQDKFHHAVTGMTASKLVMDRAHHTYENMGIRTLKGDFPTLDEAKTGKNYLSESELYRLHLLSEQFLLFAESTALSDQQLTMESLHSQLDKLLTLNNYPVFEGYQDYIKVEADRHAKIELGLYKKRRKIESLGYEYNEESLLAGEYDDLLIDA